MKNQSLTPEVRKLGWVSLLTDLSGEMLYPVIPLFLKASGMNTAFIGAMEGIAESIAAWGKGYFGAESDRTGRRKIYIVGGYGISTLSKILMALSVFPSLIMLARMGDRMGKGMRSAPRDALLAHESTPEHQGRIFGYHRAMDTIGAAIGPTVTLIFIYFFKWNISKIFLLAVIPGLLGWLLTLLVRENPTPIKTNKRTGFFKPITYIFSASSEYKKVVGPLFIFALFNPTDFLVILFLKHAGYTDAGVVGSYILYNFIYALASYPAGVFTDKKGSSVAVILGILIFASVYFGITQGDSTEVILVFVGLYGLYAAFTDGTSKAWISKITNASEKGTAIGCMQTLQSIGAILSGVVFGALIEIRGFENTFTYIGAGALFSALLLILAQYKSS